MGNAVRAGDCVCFESASATVIHVSDGRALVQNNRLPGFSRELVRKLEERNAGRNERPRIVDFCLHSVRMNELCALKKAPKGGSKAAFPFPLDLPKPVFCRLLEFLPPRDIRALAQCSRKLHSHVANLWSDPVIQVLLIRVKLIRGKKRIDRLEFEGYELLELPANDWAKNFAASDDLECFGWARSHKINKAAPLANQSVLRVLQTVNKF